MNETNKLLKTLARRPEIKTPIATDMFVPNHSGDLSAGKVLTTPTHDNDPANKKYVDDEISYYVPYTGATSDVDLGANDLTVDTDTLFIDSTNNKVGIGTASPTANLHVKANGSNEAFFRVEAGDTGNRAGFYLIQHNSANDGDYFSFSMRGDYDDLTCFVKDVSAGTYHNLFSFKYLLDTLNFNANSLINAGKLGIGTSTITTSAALDITSTTGALLVPRMTTTQKNALTPTAGMIVYDTTLNAFYFYEAGAWVTK